MAILFYCVFICADLIRINRKMTGKLFHHALREEKLLNSLLESYLRFHKYLGFVLGY